MFQNRKLLIATKHKKEKVIGPIFEKELGVSCFVNETFDTDLLGTFTGEIERERDPISTVREKCLCAMKESDCDLGVASEGSFGPHPSMFFIHADDEYLIFIDKKNNLEVIVRELSSSTNFNGKQIQSQNELMEFAKDIGFPEHGLILRKSKEENTEIQKGITDLETLSKTFEGTYTFKVRAANQFNIWNKPLSYTFTILPPYYRTWWAYCLYIIVFVGIVLSYSYLNHQKSIKLAQLIIQKQDEEKQRISRDLHDDLGQELSYLKLNTAIENKPTIDRIIQKLRAISYNLSPVKIIDSSIKDLLRELIIEAEKSNLFFSYELDDIDIKNNETKINLFRITQEGLTNIIKHSKAENVRVTLKKTDDYLVLELQDNGIGISSQKNSNTIGLSSMKERAKIINASITIETTEKGTKIKLKLPSNEV